MQASKLSRCHGDTADRWPCELAYDSGPHKPTDSASGSASRQVVLAAQANTNSTTAYRKAPRCLDNFPCDQRGRQRRALGQNRAAAPQRRPPGREPFSIAHGGTVKGLVCVWLARRGISRLGEVRGEYMRDCNWDCSRMSRLKGARCDADLRRYDSRTAVF